MRTLDLSNGNGMRVRVLEQTVCTIVRQKNEPM